MSRTDLPRAAGRLAAATFLSLLVVGCESGEARTSDGAETTEASAPAATSSAQSADPVYLNPEGSTGGNFSEGVRMGNMIYLSGKLGTARGPNAENGIEPETRRALESIQAALERYGSGMDRVVKCTVFLADVGDFGAMNRVYTTFFPEGRRPARSTVAAGGLVAGAAVEIECMAAAGAS